jgi:hypothetical protein
MAKQADVVIEVEGGVATCTRLPAHTVLQIIDHDSEKMGQGQSVEWYETEIKDKNSLESRARAFIVASHRRAKATGRRRKS